jgi:signal transduction histidine kinase/ActR/RegA family two-component response regulator
MKSHTAGVARWYRIAMIGSIALPAVLYAVVAALTHVQAIDGARERLERASRIAQEHADRVVETNEVLSRSLVNAVDALPEQEILHRRAELHEQLARLVSGLPQIHSLWIWGSDGRPLASSRFADPPAINVSDREYFQWAESHRGDDWFVSRPLVSRSTGELFFNFTRRREDAKGHFLGAVSVSLYPSFFVDFYRELARREHGLEVLLVRTDGAIVAGNVAAREQEWMRDAVLLKSLRAGGPSGEIAEPAGGDSDARRFAYRRIEHLPLYAIVSLDRATILSEWRREMGVLGAFAFPLAAGLAFVCWLAQRNALQLAAAMHAYRDEVDQRNRAEAALRQAQKLEALGQITGGVAHDFNNVLMVVATSNELARRQVAAGDSSARAFAAVEQAVKTGTQLTRQLLTFARRQPLQASTILLQQMLPPLLSLIQTTVGGAIRVEGSVDEALGPVHIDRAEFELALINLAVNARDAMPAGGTLEVRAALAPLQATDPVGGRFASVAVSDTGEGIPPEIRERVFEPFFTTKRPGVGTGLGLAQVYGFAVQAGGDVRVDSAVGVGTTVTLRLPISEHAPEEVVAGAGEMPRLSGRLLLVEDNAAVGAALQPLLAQLGLEVEHCPDAEEALALLGRRAGDFDVVLSDIVMPGSRNGIELAVAVAAGHSSLPVVLMSGYAPELQRAVAAGITVLPKPCTPTSLGTALARALAGRSASAAA